MTEQQCDICIKPVGKIIPFECFQPTENKTYTKYVCEKCIHRLVEKHFSLLNVL